jgi:hypothetical protein
MYRIDTSMNDAPYQGIHIFKDNEHILTLHEDDAPVRDFNAAQHVRAVQIVSFMNTLGKGAEQILDAFKHASFPKPHERIKL